MFWVFFIWIMLGLFAQWLVYQKYKDQFRSGALELDDLIIHIILIIICGPVSIILFLMDENEK